MIQAQNSFKHYINSLKQMDDTTLSKTRRKINKRAWRGRWYGGIGGGLSSFTGGNGGSGGMMGECLRAWREVETGYEEEQEETPDLDAAPVQDIDADDIPDLGNEDPELRDEIEEQEPENPDRQGIIRTVEDAHLVYKRQQEDGTFEELWIYNVGDKLQNEVDIRRDILAGTDIPAKKTRTSDGQQSYEMWTAGNAQMILIRGLPN